MYVKHFNVKNPHKTSLNMSEWVIELSFEWIHWTDSQSICHLQTTTLFDTEIAHWNCNIQDAT